MDSTDYLAFGDLLVRYRQRAKLTQEALAERADLSVQGISALERGKILTPWRKTVLALADALQLTAEDREPFIAMSRRATPPLANKKSTPPPADPSMPPLVGRAYEQAQIQQLLRGQGTPMLVYYGEPGIGKSRLLQEAETQALRAGWVALSGGGQREDGQHPYTPVIQALEQRLAEQSRAQRRQALNGCEWMTRLMPELADVAPLPKRDWRLPSQQERRHMFADVGRYLARIGASTGVLLILDDLQWAEPDGLSLLTSLLRAAARDPAARWLRVVAASRDVRLADDHPLPRMLHDLAREHLVTRARLDPLDMAHAETLVRLALGDEIDGVPPEEREALIRRTLACGQGVPLFLTSFASEIRNNWLAGRRALSDESIPWEITEMFRQRMRSLPDSTQEILAAAAVNGREIPLPALERVCELSKEAVIQAVEAAYADGLLRELGDGSCAFRHDLAREAALANLSVARRKLLSERIAQALNEHPQPSQIVSLAFHYGQSGDTERAVIYLEQAGDQAHGLHANAAAEAQYREALRLLASLDNVPLTARVQEKLGALLMNGGRYDDALAQLEAAAVNYECVGDLDGVGRLVAQIGWTHVRRGSAQDGMRRLEPMLTPQMLRNLAAKTQATLWRAHAALLFLMSHYADQLDSARRACALAHETGDRGALVQGMRLEGLALVLLGRFSDATPVLEETIRLAESVGDLDSYSAALNDAAAVHRACGRLQASFARSQRAMEAAERLGDPMGTAFMESSHGDDAFLLGQWRVARQRFEHAVSVVREMGESWVAAYPLADLGKLNLVEGKDDAAVTLLSEADACAVRDGDIQALRYVRTIIAERDLILGKAADAMNRLDPLLDRSGVGEKESTALLPLLAWAYLDLDAPDRAGELLQECQRQTEATGAQLVRLEALLTQARLHIHRAEWEQAAQSLREAIASAREMTYPYAEARALSLQGEYLAQRGAAHEAQSSLCAARDLFRHLGERFYARRTMALLRQLGDDDSPLPEDVSRWRLDDR